jgi:hypothetical protein
VKKTDVLRLSLIVVLLAVVLALLVAILALKGADLSSTNVVRLAGHA